MDLPEEHDATDTDRQPEDARTLVAALTNLLVNDPSPVQGTESRAILAGTRAELQRPADRHADAVLREFTSTSSSSNDGLLDEERRTPPEFLGESQVREALHRANSLRPQGHLDDEPHFPSSFLGTHSRLRVEGEWGGAHRDLPPIDPVLVAHPDASYPSRSPALRVHSQGPRFYNLRSDPAFDPKMSPTDSPLATTSRALPLRLSQQGWKWNVILLRQQSCRLWLNSQQKRLISPIFDGQKNNATDDLSLM
jgi:hypothetical protein